MGLRDNPLDPDAALRDLEARVRRLEAANPLQAGTIDGEGQVRVASGGAFVADAGSTVDIELLNAGSVLVRGDATIQGALSVTGATSLQNLSVAGNVTGTMKMTGLLNIDSGQLRVKDPPTAANDAPGYLMLIVQESTGNVFAAPIPSGGTGGGGGPDAGSFMWPFPESSVTDDYGPRPGIGKGYHDGIDFGQPNGTPIPAIGDGVVTGVAIHSDAGPYAIDIDHGGGFHSQYWHNSARYVSTGQVVSKGDIIGAVGNLGLSYGAHLHLEIIGPGSPSGRYSWPWRDFYATYGATGVGG